MRKQLINLKSIQTLAELVYQQQALSMCIFPTVMPRTMMIASGARAYCSNISDGKLGDSISILLLLVSHIPEAEPWQEFSVCGGWTNRTRSELNDPATDNKDGNNMVLMLREPSMEGGL